MTEKVKQPKKPKARNFLAVAAHFRKAGAIEPVKGKLPRKAKHKQKLSQD